MGRVEECHGFVGEGGVEGEGVSRTGRRGCVSWGDCGVVGAGRC